MPSRKGKSMNECRSVTILNKTRSSKERWRILSGGMGYCHEPENSPARLFRIGYGRKYKDWAGDYHYSREMSLLLFFEEAESPLLVRKNARDWLIANGYIGWLTNNNLFLLEEKHEIVKQ
jgi:hypothetical protein